MMIPSKDTVILSLERADFTAGRPVFQRARPTLRAERLAPTPRLFLGVELDAGDVDALRP
jgi:hypothetical protein